MPFPFICPHCGAETLVPDHYEHQQGPCATCGQPVVVQRAPRPPRRGPATTAPPPRSVGLMLGALGIVSAFSALSVWLFITLVWPSLRRDPAEAARLECRANLIRIGIALQAYHKVHRCFPPAVVVDAAGVPQHSWRVLLLPYLDQQELYQQYDFSEPWDGPNNSLLARMMPAVYASPADLGAGEQDLTSYLAVTGEGTVFPRTRAVSLSEIADGSSNTAMVVESTQSAIAWLEPDDLRVSRMQFQPHSAPGRGPRSEHGHGPHVLLADGQVRLLRGDASPQAIQALFTIAAGEPIDWNRLEQ